ncbi:MAG: glycosyltransferase family 4 protein [Candidatus Bathyarchaeia archaeon]
MKVAIVVPYASFVEVNMAKAFEYAGVSTYLVKTNKERFEYRTRELTFEKYCKTFELPCLIDNKLIRGYAPFPLMLHIFTLIENLDPDIINVSEHVSAPTWLFSIFKKKWKVVLTEHGSCWKSARDRIYNMLTSKLLIRRIDGFVGIGFKSKSFLERIGAQNVRVIPNPVDCNLFKPTLLHNEKQNIILYVGKADTFRGLHILLAAMKFVRKKIQDARLWIIGPRGNLSDHIKKGDGNVKYLGSKPHYEMPIYYNQAKVFVNPFAHSVVAGIGCATSEALACGTPIVVTKFLDFPFVWKNGEVGYLSENATPLDLANAIVKVLYCDDDIQHRCRKLAVKEFSFQSVGRRYYNLFKELLE